MSMTRTQYLLGKLAEEASEVAQIALKAQQYGLTERYPGSPKDNAERVHAELDDLLAVVSELNAHAGLGYSTDPDAVSSKKRKMAHYRKYSESLGMVQETSDED